MPQTGVMLLTPSNATFALLEAEVARDWGQLPPLLAALVDQTVLGYALADSWCAGAGSMCSGPAAAPCGQHGWGRLNVGRGACAAMWLVLPADVLSSSLLGPAYLPECAAPTALRAAASLRHASAAGT